MYEILTPRNKTLSVCMVFAISSIIHEYILSFSIRFFYPVLLLLFGVVGLTVVFVLKSAGNVFLWFSLSVGNGVLVSLYCMEYFARINCPSTRDDFWDLVIPRTWTCIFKWGRLRANLCKHCVNCRMQGLILQHHNLNLNYLYWWMIWEVFTV